MLDERIKGILQQDPAAKKENKTHFYNGAYYLLKLLNSGFIGSIHLGYNESLRSHAAVNEEQATDEDEEVQAEDRHYSQLVASFRRRVAGVERHRRLSLVSPLLLHRFALFAFSFLGEGGLQAPLPPGVFVGASQLLFGSPTTAAVVLLPVFGG